MDASLSIIPLERISAVILGNQKQIAQHFTSRLFEESGFIWDESPLEEIIIKYVQSFVKFLQQRAESIASTREIIQEHIYIRNVYQVYTPEMLLSELMVLKDTLKVALVQNGIGDKCTLIGLNQFITKCIT